MNSSFRNHMLWPLVCMLLIMAWSSSTLAGPMQNWALGASYTLEPLPSYEPTRDADDASKLTDGRQASGHFWSSKETLGWKDSGLLQIEIDLGMTRPVDRICMNTARGMQAEVDFPEAVGLFASSDREKYVSLGDLYQGKEHESGPYKVQEYCASSLAASGRYILLIVQPKGHFTFVDEVEVFGANAVDSGRHLSGIKMTRHEAIESMEEEHVMRHHRLALAQLARQMLARVPDVLPDVRRRIVFLVSELELRSFAPTDALARYEEQLFSLNRLTLAGHSGRGLIVWRKSPWKPFGPLDIPAANALNAPELMFNLMRHGVASDAFVVTNNSDKAEDIHITMVPAGGHERAPRFELREVQPVIAANHATIGDALKPAGHGKIAIKPGESRQFWITVHGEQSDAGNYRGRITVAYAGDRNSAQEVGMRVKIWPAAFPERPQVFVNAWAYLNDRLVSRFPQAAAHDLSAHHVNVAVLHASQLPWPNLQDDPSGAIDYTKSDALLRFQKDARKRLFFLNFNDKELRSFGGRIKFMSPEWQRTFKNWIKDWAAHLRDQGLGFQDFAFYPVDEPRNREEVAVLQFTAMLIKEVDPQLQVFTTLGELTSMDLLRLRDTVDIVQVLLPERESVRAIMLKKMGKQVWTYTAEGGGKQASPTGFYRAQAWKAFQAGAAGIGFWAYADAGPSGTAWNDFDGSEPDYAVVYEGSKNVVGSKRWEAWREGVEDFELLAMARRKLRSGREIGEFDAAVQSVIDDPENDHLLETTRRYLLSLASG